MTNLTPKKERSRAYPVMPVDEAIVRITNLNENLGIKGQYNRETIAIGMGYTGLNGASARTIAALTQYGLLDREKDQYRLSATARKYLIPNGDEDQVEAVKAAALSPTLFSEIYHAFRGQVIPKQLVNRLINEFGIQQKAAPDVERIFKETMKTAGILQNNNILDAEQSRASGAGAGYPSINTPANYQNPGEAPDPSSSQLTVELPSGLVIRYDQTLASAFAFGEFGSELKALNDAVVRYKEDSPQKTKGTQDE